MQAGLVSKRLTLSEIFVARGLTVRGFVTVLHVFVTVQSRESDAVELPTLSWPHEQERPLDQQRTTQTPVDLRSVLEQWGQVVGARVQLLNIRDQRLQQRVDLHLAVGGFFDAPLSDP